MRLNTLLLKIRILLYNLSRIANRKPKLFLITDTRSSEPKFNETVFLCDNSDEIIKALKLTQMPFYKITLPNISLTFLKQFDQSINTAALKVKRYEFLITSRNYERNPLVSDLAILCFIVKYVENELITKRYKYFVTDKKEVAEFFKFKYEKRSNSSRHSKAFLRNFIKELNFFVKVLYWFTRNRWLCRNIDFDPESEILINTYLSASDIKKNVFHDRYFPGLRHFLNINQLRVRYLISGEIWFPRKLIYSQSNGNIFVPEFSYYHYSDLKSAFLACLKYDELLHAELFVDDLDVSFLWKRKHQNLKFKIETMHHILRLNLINRMYEKNERFKIIISEYEGMLVEKLLAFSAKQSKRVSVFALQHNFFSEFIRCSFPIESDNLYGFLPDKIFFIGKFYLEKFEKEYSDYANYGSCPAYRFDSQRVSFSTESRKGIVIIGPTLFKDNESLLIEVAKNSFTLKHRPFFLIVHPSMKEREKNRVMQLAKRLDIEILDESIDYCLKHFTFFASTTSSGLLQAYLNGRKVLRFKSDSILDIDPMSVIDSVWDFREFRDLEILMNREGSFTLYKNPKKYSSIIKNDLVSFSEGVATSSQEIMDVFLG